MKAWKQSSVEASSRNLPNEPLPNLHSASNEDHIQEIEMVA
jgi:hypothetical protein